MVAESMDDQIEKAVEEGPAWFEQVEKAVKKDQRRRRQIPRTDGHDCIHILRTKANPFKRTNKLINPLLVLFYFCIVC